MKKYIRYMAGSLAGRCDVIVQDGYPFYRTKDGSRIYSFNGLVFEGK